MFKQVVVIPVFLCRAHWPEMGRPHEQAKVINYRQIEEHSQNLMRDYSYHTVRSVINAFKKCKFSR